MKNFIALMMMSLICGSAWAATGERWEISSKMEMPGMPFAMPAQTQQTCMQKGAETDPARAMPGKDNCTISDVKHTGNKTTFNLKCTGKDAMTGNAEMTNFPGAYIIKMAMRSKDGEMNMNTSGKRVGSCDYAQEGAPAQQAKMEAMVKKSQAENDALMARVKAAQQRSCDEQRSKAKSYDGYSRAQMFVTKKQLAEYDAETQQAYKNYMKSQQAACPINYTANLKALCMTAEQDNQIDFAIDYCPAQAAAMQSKYCGKAGRSYTAYGRLCGDNQESEGGAKDKSPIEVNNNPGKALLEGAKNLKGMFGF